MITPDTVIPGMIVLNMATVAIPTPVCAIRTAA
jgi:hypothetical protein